MPGAKSGDMADASDRPEPRLVALHRERQLARDHLADGYAKGYLEAAELERRLESAERATTIAELRALTEDLVVHPTAAGAMVAAGRADLAPVVAPAELRLSAVFSESRHSGPWIPARVTHVRSLFASMKLDLREARLAPGLTELRLAVTFGDLEIIVPPGLSVQVGCAVVFGDVGQDGDEPGDPDPDRPRLVLSGRVLFGAVRVRRRLPGEGWWGAKKRQLFGPSASGRRALPPKDEG